MFHLQSSTSHLAQVRTEATPEAFPLKTGGASFPVRNASLLYYLASLEDIAEKLLMDQELPVEGAIQGGELRYLLLKAILREIKSGWKRLSRHCVPSCVRSKRSIDESGDGNVKAHDRKCGKH